MHKNRSLCNLNISYSYAGLEYASDIMKIFNSVAAEGIYLSYNSMPISLNKFKDIFNLGLDKHCIITALINMKEPIGYIEMMRLDGVRREHVATFTLLVMKDLRGLGIGKKLLELGIKWAEINSIEKLVISSLENNTRALNLYKSYGFEITGKYKKQFRFGNQYIDEIFLEKFL